ncbi:hypothetical protein [Roseibium salinum]|uniref:Uncharacterized protein n=1 Tax=Roseibium salinum TaxID=1604349 RepID=A0ABT3R2Z6_9HYPH|nr:hypothetical protein [Roseibium sp. DSM 29163]MCX2723583.1 hypothetical protein [Roseibium sp. DSM 29163]
MSEKDQQDQRVDAGRGTAADANDKAGEKGSGKSREDRLAEALRANLRRRKSAAKSRKED